MYTDTLHILLAEDDQDDRMLFTNVFDEVKMNHMLHICEDGLSLMKYLQNTEEIPHILFLDLNMPEKSGIDCLKEIKNDPRLKDITIAIYSSFSIPSTIEQTFVLGANVYIKKPNDFENLRKILTEIIYINWQYMTDGLNKENFMMNY